MLVISVGFYKHRLIKIPTLVFKKKSGELIIILIKAVCFPKNIEDPTNKLRW